MTTTTADQTTLSTAVNGVIDKAIEEERLVGARVLVAVDGEIAHSRSAGLADREASKPMPEDPIFLLSSITKPIVSAMAMSLVETGDLDLRAPITRYLPDFRPTLADGTAPTITIEQLLTHTSGLAYGMDPESFDVFLERGISNGLDRPGLSATEAAERLVQAPLLFAPGERWSYSLGIDVVGWAIEAITGDRLGEVTAERITDPLGITDLAFTITDPSRLVTPYASSERGLEPMQDGLVVDVMGMRTTFAPSRATDSRSYHSGGAGMVGSAESVLRVLETIRTGGGLILQPQTVASMVRSRAGDGATAAGPGVGFGLGWTVVTDAAAAQTPQSNGTIGWGGVYGHSWFVDPTRRLTVVAMTNAYPEGLFGQFTSDLRDAVYAAL